MILLSGFFSSTTRGLNFEAYYGWMLNMDGDSFHKTVMSYGTHTRIVSCCCILVPDPMKP